MTIDLYYMAASPPARAVLLLAKALNLKLNLISVDMLKKEHLKPSFVEMNPQHTIPTLNDNGYVIWESRAILGYLVDKYAKSDALYPKDVKKRAMVNQMLHFDIGTLYARLGVYMYPLFAGGKPDPAQIIRVEEALGFLNTSLESRAWVAGEHKTIADYTIVVSVSTAEELGFDLKKFPKVVAWLNKVKEDFLDYQELNGSQAKILADYIKNASKEAK